MNREETAVAVRNSIDSLLAWADAQPAIVLCKVCGQELTDPKSIARGIGPICLEKGEEVADG